MEEAVCGEGGSFLGKDAAGARVPRRILEKRGKAKKPKEG